MRILYRDHRGNPGNGDVKLLSDGRKFLRQQRRYNGMYVVSRGRPVYEWYAYDDDAVSALRENLDAGVFKVSEVGAKRQKGEIVHIRLSGMTLSQMHSPN